MPLIDERFAPVFLVLFGNERRQLTVLESGVTIGDMLSEYWGTGKINEGSLVRRMQRVTFFSPQKEQLVTGDEGKDGGGGGNTGTACASLMTL